MASRTVIVVDDDSSNCDAIADSLADGGYAVQTVLDPQDAQRVARGTPRPCVLVIDLMMPMLSGAELIAHLRADPATADIPVITCSAGLGEMPPGADRHLSKPFDIETLLQVVAEVFSGGLHAIP